MEMQELEITIDRNGRMQVAVRGTRGEGCLLLSKNFENAVGRVEEREYTPEYYEQSEDLAVRRYATNR